MRLGFFDAFLHSVERLGNALPHLASLFAGLAFLVILLRGWIRVFIGRFCIPTLFNYTAFQLVID
jgi:p-aminobenzoyl-glutamate transporter AbgT